MTIKYAGSRSKKETRLGQAHLAPGMTEARLLEIYRAHDIHNLADLDTAPDAVIDSMVEEVAGIVSAAKAELGIGNVH